MNDFTQRLVGCEAEEDVDVVSKAVHIGEVNVLAFGLVAQVLT